MGFVGRSNWKECSDCGRIYDEIECPDCLDDRIEEWHTGDSPLELHEFLGWTFEEYVNWLGPIR